MLYEYTLFTIASFFDISGFLSRMSYKGGYDRPGASRNHNLKHLSRFAVSHRISKPFLAYASSLLTTTHGLSPTRPTNMLSAFLPTYLLILAWFNIPALIQVCALIKQLAVMDGSVLDKNYNEKNADQRHSSRGVACCHR